MFPLRTPIKVSQDSKNNRIFSFEGELDETNADATFRRIYDQLENDWSADVIFDFQGLTYLNSKAIGYITDVYSHTDNHGSKLILRNLQDQVYDILDIVGLTDIIDIRKPELPDEM